MARIKRNDGQHNTPHLCKAADGYSLFALRCTSAVGREEKAAASGQDRIGKQ